LDRFRRSAYDWIRPLFISEIGEIAGAGANPFATCRERSTTMAAAMTPQCPRWTPLRLLAVTRLAGLGLAALVLGLPVALAGCGEFLDKTFCANGNCGWSQVDSDRIAALADLPETPPVDPTNKYLNEPMAPMAEALGRQFFFDPRFSGTSAMADSIGRPVPYARAPKGQPLNIACATCHDLTGGAADPSTTPGDVSIGASWTDTNALSVWNAGFQKLQLWNGRSDSLWGQATGTIETAMGGNRLSAGWVIADHYRADYEALFTDCPPGSSSTGPCGLPMAGTSANVSALLDTTGMHPGQCALTGGLCAPPCRLATSDDGTMSGCWPRFPLNGKPGAQDGCQPGDPTEPFGDAYDCMDPADQITATQVAVNFGKAVAAFEFKLVNRASPFDEFVADLRAGRADESLAIPAQAKLGARLFVGKAACSDCHNGPLLSSGEFYNVGVQQTGAGVPTVADCPKGGVCDCATPKNCLPYGARDGIAKLRKNQFLRTSIWSDSPTDNSRAAYLTGSLDAYPIASFRVPSLRGVALTAPYMHDGSLATLEEVVALYNRGGDPEAVGVPAPRIKPLMLTDDEEAQLVAFLRTLTGQTPSPDYIAPPDLP
jgi:cytochrome c peroxidase